jgi:hypothetical protein
MICPRCRARVEGDARYCPKCGKLLTSKPSERAVNNIYLVVAAIGVTLSINIPLVSFVLRLTPKTEPFAYFFAYDLSPFLFGVLFGLAVLLILEFLGNFFKPFDKDWSLIMAWGRAWANWNIPLGLLLSFALAWWWIFATAFLFVVVTWGAAFMLAAGILLSPIIGLVNWVLGWVYAFFNSIISRFFVIVPHFLTEKDREKAVELLKNLHDRLQGTKGS